MPNRFLVPAPGLSLAHTLSSGQTFCWQWQPTPQAWQGWIGGEPVELLQKSDAVEVTGHKITASQIRHYFSLDLDWPALQKSLARDPHLAAALQEVSGLRIVREPWWECTANFICSSLKQIVQIQQINCALRTSFGPVFHKTRKKGFPSAPTLA